MGRAGGGRGVGCVATKGGLNMATSVGYSGTPLTKKLGIQPGMRVAVLNEPGG